MPRLSEMRKNLSSDCDIGESSIVVAGELAFPSSIAYLIAPGALYFSAWVRSTGSLKRYPNGLWRKGRCVRGDIQHVVGAQVRHHRFHQLGPGSFAEALLHVEHLAH